MRFIEGDVLAHGGDRRQPYGRVVEAGAGRRGPVYLIHLYNPPPSKVGANTVCKTEAELQEYDAIPSAVRGIDRQPRTDTVAGIWRQGTLDPRPAPADDDLFADFG